MADVNWNGATSNWNVGGNWGGSVPQETETAAATAGTVTVTDTETVGGIDFSQTAELLINGGSLEVGVGQQGGNVNSFVLGPDGAVLNGAGSELDIDSYLTGTASGTIYLEGSEFDIRLGAAALQLSGSCNRGKQQRPNRRLQRRWPRRHIYARRRI